MFKKIIVVCVLLCSLFIPSVVGAQANNPFNKELSGTAKALPKDFQAVQSPFEVFARVLNVALGLIGLIMMTLFLYAGYLWMTAQGDSGKVDEAKKIMTRAVIGTLIVLMSYGIVSFVMQTFLSTRVGGVDRGALIRGGVGTPR